jgi:hypothetical protein
MTRMSEESALCEEGARQSFTPRESRVSDPGPLARDRESHIAWHGRPHWSTPSYRRSRVEASERYLKRFISVVFRSFDIPGLDATRCSWLFIGRG